MLPVRGAYTLRLVLFVVQLPLIDARALIATETRKLDRPRFALGADDFEPEFLRSFGPLERADPGAPPDWPCEMAFCSARNGFRLTSSGLSTLDRELGAGSFQVAFRRFLSNAETIGRAELGLEAKHRAQAERLTGERMIEILRRLAQLPLHVGNGEAALDVTLANLGPALSTLVLASTTGWQQTPAGFETASWWVSPGAPVVIVEFREHELSVPSGAVAVELSDPAIDLAYLRGPAGIPHVWFVRSSARARADRIRQIRLHLTRLHTERESIRVVLRLVAEGRLSMTADPDDELNLFLERADGFLRRGEPYGNPQSEMLRVVARADSSITGNLRTSLEQELGKTRHTLRRRLQERVEAEERERKKEHRVRI